MPSFEELTVHLDNAGQSHVLRFWSELTEEDRDVFLSELSLLDLGELKAHCEGAAKAAATGGPSVRVEEQHIIEPLPEEFVGSIQRSEGSTLADWENEGLLQISENRVAVLLLAGGQGTRLGVSYPKGMYDVGLPSSKTLYQLQAERIRKIQELATLEHGSKCTVPWYIMTSEFTLKPTENFFKENHYFGLEPSNIIMFEQRMIPAVTFDGKIILQGKGKVAMAPDGNGGLYRAVMDNKVLEDMTKRGVEYLHIYCVDNILVKIADPIFIGFCVSKGADCGAKVVQKAYPEEPVGVVCKVGGVCQVVEYSEIQPETAALRGPGGGLIYSAGNICNHFFTRTFLQEVAQTFEGELTQHAAIKKVPFVDSDGNQIKPTKPNGIKMEKFVFDAFQFSRNFVAFEVLREEEFSPLKNADGASLDTPTTARHSLLTQHCRWAQAAGATLLDDHGNVHPTMSREKAEDITPVKCEISPLVSYFGEGLEKLLKGKTVTTPFILDEKRAKELQSSVTFSN